MLFSRRISALRQINHLVLVHLLGIFEKSSQRACKRVLVPKGDRRNIKRHDSAVAQVDQGSLAAVVAVDQFDGIEVEPDRVAVLRRMGRKENQRIAVILADDDRRFVFDPDGLLGIECGAFKRTSIKCAGGTDDFIDRFLHDEFAAVFNYPSPVPMAIHIR